MFKGLKNVFYKDRRNSDFKENNPYLFRKYKVYDVYQETFDKREELTLSGDLVLGALVMANNNLYKRFGMISCPGVFIYSNDEYYEINQGELLKLAYSLYDLKTNNTKVEEIESDKDKAEITTLLKDERRQIDKVKLPESLTQGREVFMTTVFFIRHELKQRRVNQPFYPLLVKEDIPYATILNYKYYEHVFTFKPLHYIIATIVVMLVGIKFI